MRIVAYIILQLLIVDVAICQSLTIQETEQERVYKQFSENLILDSVNVQKRICSFSFVVEVIKNNGKATVMSVRVSDSKYLHFFSDVNFLKKVDYSIFFSPNEEKLQFIFPVMFKVSGLKNVKEENKHFDIEDVFGLFQVDKGIWPKVAERRFFKPYLLTIDKTIYN